MLRVAAVAAGTPDPRLLRAVYSGLPRSPLGVVHGARAAASRDMSGSSVGAWAIRRHPCLSGLPALSSPLFAPALQAIAAVAARGRGGAAPLPAPLPLATGARPFFTRFAQHRQLQSLEKEAAAAPGDAVRQAAYLKKLNTHDPEAVLSRVDSQQYALNQVSPALRPADPHAAVGAPVRPQLPARPPLADRTRAQDGLIEYVKALVLVGRFDRNDLAHVNRLAESNGLPDFPLSLAGNLAASQRAGAGGAGPAGAQVGYGNAAGGAGARFTPGGMGAAGGQGAGGTSANPLLISMAEPSMKEQLWKTVRTLAMAYFLLLGITTIMEERGLSRSSTAQHSVTQAAESSKTFKDVVHPKP